MCQMCNSSELHQALKEIAVALVAGSLAEHRNFNLGDYYHELQETEDVARALNQMVQVLAGSQASVTVFPKARLTVAEEHKSTYGTNTFHMGTYVFMPSSSGIPTYFGIGGHDDGIALFDHVSQEVLDRQEATATLRAKLDEYTTIGSQRERALTESLRARLMQVLETTEPTDEQQALLALALGKDWRNTVHGPGWISVRTILGLLELFGQTKNPAFPEDVR